MDAKSPHRNNALVRNVLRDESRRQPDTEYTLRRVAQRLGITTWRKDAGQRMDGSDYTWAVERIEMLAEGQGKRGDTPTPHSHLEEVLQDRQVTELQLVRLTQRWWMFYAAGLYDQEEAADVTIRRWRGED